MEKYSEKHEKLLLKICKDLKINNEKEVVKDYIKNANVCS